MDLKHKISVKSIVSLGDRSQDSELGGIFSDADV
jgi:hypothetical protein